MVSTTLSIPDSVTSKASNKKHDMDAILPFILLPVLFLIATASRTITIIIMVVIAMGVLYVHSRPRQKNRSPFFYSWTLSSGITMIVIFEIEILGLLEITMLENILFLLLLTWACYFFYKMKAISYFELTCGYSKGKEYSPVLTSDSYYCQICQIEVNERFFHSIWWGCCILKSNYIYYLLGQLFAFITLLVGTNLGLTTICQPVILYGSVLIPHNCEEVYHEFNLALCFVACVYATGYIFVTFFVLIQQVFVYIPKFSKYQRKKLANERNV